MDRTSWVGGDELQVDGRTRELVAVAEVCAGGKDVLDDLALRSGGQADVDEARPCDSGFVDALVRAEGFCQPGAELARVRTSLLGHLHGDVRCVVAVLRVARALHSHGVGDNRGVEIMVCKHALCGGFYGGGKFCWRHGHAV